LTACLVTIGVAAWAVREWPLRVLCGVLAGSFPSPEKKKTRRWERRVRTVVVIGVYGFKYAAWLSVIPCWSCPIVVLVVVTAFLSFSSCSGFFFLSRDRI